MTSEIPGSISLLKATSKFYTDKEVRARIPGSRQNGTYHIALLRRAAGVEDRGTWFFHKGLVDRYFAALAESKQSKIRSTPKPSVKKKRVSRKKKT